MQFPYRLFLFTRFCAVSTLKRPFYFPDQRVPIMSTTVTPAKQTLLDVRKSPATTSTTRLMSIDALRGFDMFWITSGDDLIKQLCKWAWATFPALHQYTWLSPEHVNRQLEHARWEGFYFYDLIFPLFLFLVGVVLPFSLGKIRERGDGGSAVHWRVARRVVLLFTLGLVYNGLLHFDWPALRIAGVLQRIAICYGIAAIIVLKFGVRMQALITVGLLLGYWALLAFVAAPGGVAGDYSMEHNLAGWVDRHYLPGKIYQAYYGFGDNEGLLSTIPAIATALLGALAGQFLRTGWSAWKKVLLLAVAGGACVVAGNEWGHVFPIIKNLWTSSFVLVAGGWSLLLLALFYGIIDGLGFRMWAFFFVVIGANAITIYVGQHIIDFHHIADFFVGGMVKYAGTFGAVLPWIAVVAAKWLFLLYLYRRRLFLRV